MSDMKKTVTCKYCSAEYPEELANCPYCGNANFYGQEKIYMQRMSQIRKRLASLAYIDKRNLENCRNYCCRNSSYNSCDFYNYIN